MNEEKIKQAIEDLANAIDLEEARKKAQEGLKNIRKYYQLREENNA